MPGPFSPFSLGEVYQTGEAIKGMRDQSAMAALQQKYLGQRMTQDAAQEQRAQAEFNAGAQRNKLQLMAAASAAVAQDPSSASYWDRFMKEVDPQWSPTQGDPAQIQAAAKQMNEWATTALNALNNGAGTQNNVQSTQIGENGNLLLVMRDGTIKDTGQRAKPQMFYGEVGGVPTVTRATGTQTTSTPVSTLADETAAQSQIANARATGAAQVIPAEARQAARDKLPRARAAFRRLNRVATAVEGIADNMLLSGGPFQSRALSVTKEGQELDQAVSQLLPEITALTRVPGVGSQSDLEQRLANLALPSSSNYPEVNRKAIEELDAFLNDLVAAYENTSEGGATPQSAPQAEGGWKIEVVE